MSVSVRGKALIVSDYLLFVHVAVVWQQIRPMRFLALLAFIAAARGFQVSGALAVPTRSMQVRMQFGTGNYNEDDANNLPLFPIAGGSKVSTTLLPPSCCQR